MARCQLFASVEGGMLFAALPEARRYVVLAMRARRGEHRMRS